MFKKCIHEWETVTEKTTESSLEIVRRTGLVPSAAFYEMTNRKYILVLTCKKCGKLDKTIEDLY